MIVLAGLQTWTPIWPAEKSHKKAVEHNWELDVMNECYLYLLMYRWHILEVWGAQWTPEDTSVTVTEWITAVSDTLEGVLHATSGYDADPASLEHISQ